jgi:hypothetical protein
MKRHGGLWIDEIGWEAKICKVKGKKLIQQKYMNSRIKG